MGYKITENDVRLLRRILVAYNVGERGSAKRIIKYLRKKGLNFVLPEDQQPGDVERYKVRLPVNECWLVDHYGGILLPDYYDIIFLNSMWINPYTMFVRLVEEVPELGELGKINWIPKAIGDENVFRAAAQKMHQWYVDSIKLLAQKLYGRGNKGS